MQKVQRKTMEAVDEGCRDELWMRGADMGFGRLKGKECKSELWRRVQWLVVDKGCRGE